MPVKKTTPAKKAAKDKVGQQESMADAITSESKAMKPAKQLIERIRQDQHNLMKFLVAGILSVK